MIDRLTVTNFRCFGNFSVDFTGHNSCVILGRNGAGKSTVGVVLEMFQRIARQTSRVGELVRLVDIADRSIQIVGFVLEATVSGKKYVYSLEFDCPIDFRELRIVSEKLLVDNEEAFSRNSASVSMRGRQFGVDWHVVALPIIQTALQGDPIATFKSWMASIVVLRPNPALMTGDSEQMARLPQSSVENFGAWFTGVSVDSPGSYQHFIAFLREVMPDLNAVKNPQLGSLTRSILVEFKEGIKTSTFRLEALSDGERCFFVAALLLAMVAESNPITCFWDEPDNYLAPQEISATVFALRRAFRNQHQILITSHNPDTIRTFEDENTFILSRSSHFSSPNAKTVAVLRKESGTGDETLSMWLHGDLAA